MNVSHSIAFRRRGIQFFGMLLLTLPCCARCEADEPGKLILLHNGINSVNFDGGELVGKVVIARRDNYNAHSFEISTFFAVLKTEADSEPELKIIPIVDRDGKELFQLKTGGGADCVLFDYRLLAEPGRRDAILITADRKFGDNFADHQPVTFRYYRLTRNTKGLVGKAALYFQFEKAMVSKQRYCDVNEAFAAELHIPEDKGQRPP